MSALPHMASRRLLCSPPARSTCFVSLDRQPYTQFYLFARISLKVTEWMCKQPNGSKLVLPGTEGQHRCSTYERNIRSVYTMVYLWRCAVNHRLPAHTTIDFDIRPDEVSSCRPCTIARTSMASADFSSVSIGLLSPEHESREQ